MEPGGPASRRTVGPQKHCDRARAACAARARGLAEASLCGARCASWFHPFVSGLRYQLKMTGAFRRGRFMAALGGRRRRGIQRCRDGDGPVTARSGAAARQRTARDAQTKDVAKELHSPSPRYGPWRPSGVGRSSLVEESAGRPQAVAAGNQLVMQCRHPMLADVDVATRVDVHMPWLVGQECLRAQRAGGRAHCLAAVRECQP